MQFKPKCTDELLAPGRHLTIPTRDSLLGAINGMEGTFEPTHPTIELAPLLGELLQQSFTTTNVPRIDGGWGRASQNAATDGGHDVFPLF